MKIELRDYGKTLKGAVLLKNITCTFTSGKIYGLSGVNGSGKTMLMRAICGLIRPTTGDVFIDEVPQSTGSVERPPMGALLENPQFLDGFTGFYNLKLLAKIRNTITEAEIAEALCRVGLDPQDPRKYRKYSLGMKQRLGLAAAIMEHPTVVLLDEPFNALDRAGVALAQEIITTLRTEGCLVILSCHEQALLADLVDEMLEIENGEIIRQYEKTQKT